MIPVNFSALITPRPHTASGYLFFLMQLVFGCLL